MQPKFYFKYKKLIKYVLGLLLIGLTFFVTISLEKSVIIDVSEVGTLNSLLSKYRKENIDSLVVTGKINEMDMITIQSTQIDTNKIISQEKKQKAYIAQEFKDLNFPRIYIKYKQPVNGYTVKVLWMPYTYNGKTCEAGKAVLYFESEDNHFYIQTRSYSDTAVYSHTNLKDGDILFWDYTPKKKDEILSEYSPFFFSDVDFDGEDELLINEHRGGSRGTNSYEVYKIHPYYAEIIKDAPFANLENGNTEFDLKNKTITSSFSDSAFESVTYIYKAIKQEKIEYGDPEPCYKFELVKVEFYYRHTECNEYKVYIKDGYKYKLIKGQLSQKETIKVLRTSISSCSQNQSMYIIEQIQDAIYFLSLGIVGFVIVSLGLMLLILILASYLLSFEIIVTNEDFIRTLVIKLIAWGWTLFDWLWILLKAIMRSRVLLAIVFFGYVAYIIIYG